MTYNYEAGERALKIVFPIEYELGGIIDLTDCGELHALMAKFQEELNKDVPQ